MGKANGLSWNRSAGDPGPAVCWAAPCFVPGPLAMADDWRFSLVVTISGGDTLIEPHYFQVCGTLQGHCAGDSCEGVHSVMFGLSVSTPYPAGSRLKLPAPRLQSWSIWAGREASRRQNHPRGSKVGKSTLKTQTRPHLFPEDPTRGTGHRIGVLEPRTLQNSLKDPPSATG